MAQGAGNVVSGFFRGMPVGGSVGQTALNVSAGARTRWAAIWSGIWMLLILAGASAGAVLTHLMDDLAASLTSLGTLVSAHAADASAAVVAANALAMSATALGTVTSDLATDAAQHAADATALDQLIVTLIADANALPADVQTTPEWIQLAKDLAKAKAKADLVQGVAADIAQRAAALSTAVGKVQDQAVKLAADIKNLSAQAAGIHAKLAGDVTTAEHNLESAIAHVSGKLGNFQAQIAAAQAKIDHKITSTQAGIGRRTSAVQAKITQATSNAQAKLGQAAGSLKASLDAASQKAQADLAAAKQKVQASVQQAIGTAQTDLNKANNDYAQLLALIQIAQAHQLPGGNATGADVQNGGYVLRISGTG
jgi:hypothetical protein